MFSCRAPPHGAHDPPPLHVPEGHQLRPLQGVHSLPGEGSGRGQEQSERIPFFFVSTDKQQHISYFKYKYVFFVESVFIPAVLFVQAGVRGAISGVCERGMSEYSEECGRIVSRYSMKIQVALAKGASFEDLCPLLKACPLTEDTTGGELLLA